VSSDPRQIGPYRVLSELGRGGMGIVYEATGPDGECVALKVLLPGAGEARRTRFLREGRAQSKLCHPNVVRVLDVGLDPQRPYLVQELIRGQSLEDRIQTAGPLEPREATRIGALLADALAAAHVVGIVHRDLKPDNVLLTESDQPCLTDFGLAKDLERVGHTEALTRSGTFLGTPSFWAPEQTHAKPELIGPPADVYGLAATLHAALTGEPLFDADTLFELIKAIRVDAPPSLSRVRPDTSAPLNALIMRCLAKEASERPSAIELRDELRALDHAAPTRNLAILAGATALTIALGLALLARDPDQAPSPAPPPAASASPTAAPSSTPGEDDPAAAAYYELARREAVAGNDAEALRLAQLAAEGGHAKAMYELGAMRAEGRGAKRDLEAAIRWYRQARDRGHTGAMIDLGLLYLDGQGVSRDEARGAELFRQAAEGDDPQGMFNLGVCLAEGRGTPQDEAQAVTWFRRGAELRHADCMNNLARALNAGRGVKADPAEAVKWYRAAAATGDAVAMINLGLVLMQGEGVPRNLEQAEVWFKRAKAEGSKKERASADQALERLKLLRQLGVR
jgi:TPR repeat protein